ncbi:MAG: hypothetical protein Q9168_004290 [Polycauliona sp. 1 TL-2023]
MFPEILRTCRIICEEATPVLYQENTFAFWSDRIDLDFDHLSRNAKKACRDLMSYIIDDDDKGNSKIATSYLDIPSPIKESTLAAFLRRVGPYKASLIRGLEIMSFNPVDATDDVILATQLCATHMPDLRELTLRVFTKEGMHWEESPDYYHPDWSSPFWCNGPFKPMHRALERFVDKIGSLQVLKYDVGDDMQFRFEDPDAMVKMHELEVFVKTRAAANRTKDRD